MSGTITLRGATDDEIARIRRACGRNVDSWEEVFDWFRETETELSIRKLEIADLERKAVEEKRRLAAAREQVARENAAERDAQDRELSVVFPFYTPRTER